MPLQPFAYYFIKNVVKSFDLKAVLLDKIGSLLSTGLKVVGTICDQGTANIAYMKIAILQIEKQSY